MFGVATAGTRCGRLDELLLELEVGKAFEKNGL